MLNFIKELKLFLFTYIVTQGKRQTAMFVNKYTFDGNLIFQNNPLAGPVLLTNALLL